jgi:hypothetical protein
LDIALETRHSLDRIKLHSQNKKEKQMMMNLCKLNDNPTNEFNSSSLSGPFGVQRASAMV